MLQRLRNIGLRRADIQMSLRRVGLIEMFQPVYTWLNRFLNQISGRGKKASVISRPDPTRKNKGKDLNRVKDSKTTMQK